MVTTLLKDKLKAMSIHLAISIILAILCYLIITQIWYAAPLFKATGVFKIFVIILSVDLVLGPLLTFIVYKKYKRTLRNDLLVIAIIQLSALGYGLYSTYEARPVWIAYVADRFELVGANELIEDPDHIMLLPKTGPKYRYVQIANLTVEEGVDMFITETKYGIRPAQRPKLYRDFENARPLIVSNSSELSKLIEYNTADTVKKVLQKYPQADSFLPLEASAQDMTVLINRKANGAVVAIVDLRPW
ncbi:TfpX/TfpZ family type IV pilin accessory protein [Psychrobacter arenosus]|uniref:TfpX/TfpZ family type IV pilin accessory protein n=1 Tax=Psychrobacter arenosus TaxID=256326 RepID=UPI0019191123|nr:TfpX/TfpZ family type IV pilin accessory protein [Psychrobacter arenosus]